ncbi:cytochrome P450 [Spirillospora sp. CA-255316]
MTELPADFPHAHFSAGHPHALYERLHAAGRPVRHPAGGYWVVGTYAEARSVLARPELFRSRDGILLGETSGTYAAPPTITHTDPPDHTRYRGLVAPAFRPSVLRGLEGDVRARIRALLDDLRPGRPFDAVAELAVPLPLQVICLLLGIPEDDWARFHRWSEAIVPGAVDDLPEDERAALRNECGAYLLGTAHERREAARTGAGPAGDVITQLALAELDGDRLTDLELVMFLIQLLVAGNETTRHAISGGLHALAADPAQWSVLRARHPDPALMATAVEEILRWTSPVVYFMRTAAETVTLGGAEIAAGDRLMILYGAAGRDPAAYGPDAGAFDIARRPEATGLAFGFGPHFCLGAALARMEIRMLLEEILDRGHTGVEIAGEAVHNGSTVVTGLRRCPLALAA